MWSFQLLHFRKKKKQKKLHLCNLWVRNRAGENRPGDIRPNHFVYTCMGTRREHSRAHSSGAFVWDSNTEKANFCGHSRVHLSEHSREPFRGSISGVSLLFCPFLHFFGPKKAPFPCFGIFYPRFFRQNCAFLSPQMPLSLWKMRG